MANSRLLGRMEQITSKAGFTEFAVAFFDYETRLSFSYRGDRFFHAASTIKVAYLFAVMKAVQSGVCRLDDPLHVRNRFHSVVDGSPFRVDAARDGDTEVHRRIGRTMTIEELATAMIVRSSNLATNLLFDFLGPQFMQQVLEDTLIPGIKVLRGVEDQVAFERGINNAVTADGLIQLFRDFVEERHLARRYVNKLLEILLAQEFNAMIPAKLPAHARVAHKTGEISTCAHDAGIIFLPNRKPYVVAILTEMPAGTKSRSKSVAAISRVVFDFLVESQ